MTPIEQIKQILKLEDLVSHSFELTGKGRIRSTKEHDSLIIWTDTQTWCWYSQDVGGDILDWYQHIHRCDFRTALESLAQEANVELKPMTADEQQAYDHAKAQRQIFHIAAQHYHACLLTSPTALDYCYSRAWTDETIKSELIGYVPSPDDNDRLSAGNMQPLHAKLRDAGLLEHPAARAALSIPQNHIVYVHQQGGQVLYLSARSIEGKRHLNLPEDLVGPKVAYRNSARTNGGITILVEGQADAISIAQLAYPCDALCGLAAANLDLSTYSHVALDEDSAGQNAGAKLLPTLLSSNPGTRLIRWPSDCKDANEYLKGEDGGGFADLLEGSITVLEHCAITAKAAKGDQRNELLALLFNAYNTLDEITKADIKPDLAKHLGIGTRQFDNLLKAHDKESENNEQKEGAARFEYSAGGAIGGYVWEQCINWDVLGNGSPAFAIRDPNGDIKYSHTFDIGDTAYIPYPATLGVIKNRRIVLFPETAEEYGSEAELVKEIQTFIHDYLDTNYFYERLAAYYVLFSWMYDIFENIPYLRALGDYGTGKTRFIQTIGVLCYRPMMVSGAATASPVFRLINMFNGTLVMDEADFSNSDAENELIKIINVGYYKGGCVMRAEKEQDTDIYAPETYDVYGPKILATRKPFTDRAVESRCLTHRTTTARPRPGIPLLLNDKFWSRAQTLRNRLLMYRLRNHRSIEVDEKLANDSVEPRLNQVTMALKSIITNDEMIKEIDTFIVAYNETLISDRQMTIPAIIVQAMTEIFYSKKTDLMGNDLRDLTMQGIAEKAQKLLADIDPDVKMYSRMVAKILREELGISTNGPKHPENRRIMASFTEEELQALMKRYGIEKPLQ